SPRPSLLRCALALRSSAGHSRNNTQSPLLKGSNPMPDVTDYSAYDTELLPPVVVSYLDRQTDPKQRASLAELFAADARVVDEGIEYRGIDAIRGWLGTTASDYTY